MFATLQNKLEGALKRIRGGGVLKSTDIDDAMREVRMALLEADVNFQVAKDFCARVAEKAKGEEILKSLTPGQQVIKIVHDELVETIRGEGSNELNTRVAPPLIIMMVGLQGSGKTTTTAKLARLLKHEMKRNPLLVPADVYRPAAIEQLKTLGSQVGVEVYNSNSSQDPVTIAKDAVKQASLSGFDTVLIDTAGRLQIDQELMEELREISEAVEPHEILLVADAMTGQEAVNVAKGFDQALEIDGLVLTKMDGDARGGASLSMRAVTGKPIKFIGVGEKMDGLEVFHADRLVSRILGMGDVMTLIEKATKEVSVEETLQLQQKMKKNEFSLDDFLSQLRMMKKMGGVSSIAGMMPGMSKLTEKVNPEDAEKEIKKIEAIILSMTKQERNNQGIINGSRRKRIAKGSGTKVEDVNKLLKQFLEMKNMMNKLMKGGIGNIMKMMGGKGIGNLAGMMKK